MNKIILTGLRDLKTTEEFLPQKEYGIFLIAERISEEKMDTFSDEAPDEKKYRLKISHVQDILDLKEKKNIKFEKGKSPSQKQRYLIENELGETEYEFFMAWLLNKAIIP